MASKAERFVSKARSLEAKGRRDKALELYRDACREEPYDPDLWRARAETATAEGLHGEAAEAFFHVGDLYARGGLAAEALPVVKRVLEIDPHHGGARRLAGVLERRIALASGSLPAEPVERVEPMPELTKPMRTFAPIDDESSIPISLDDANEDL